MWKDENFNVRSHGDLSNSGHIQWFWGTWLLFSGNQIIWPCVKFQSWNVTEGFNGVWKQFLKYHPAKDTYFVSRHLFWQKYQHLWPIFYEPDEHSNHRHDSRTLIIIRSSWWHCWRIMRGPADMLLVVHAGTCDNALLACFLLSVLYVFGCIYLLWGVWTRKRWHIRACIQNLSGFLTLRSEHKVLSLRVIPLFFVCPGIFLFQGPNVALPPDGSQHA